MVKTLLTLFFYVNLLYANYSPIINGKKVNDNFKSAIVKIEIYFNNWEKHRTCTGTYVGPNSILTAAHCVENKFIKKQNNEESIQNFNNVISRITDSTIEDFTGIAIDVFPGTSIMINGNPSNISKIILHHGSDLAILVTKNTVKDYQSVSFEKIQVKQPVKMIGYGMDSVDHNSNSGVGFKQLGTNYIDSLFTIRDKLPKHLQNLNTKYLKYISDYFIAEQLKLSAMNAGWGEIGIIGNVDYDNFEIQSLRGQAAATFGDSGGPLINKDNHIIGVMSLVTYCKAGKALDLSKSSEDKAFKQEQLKLAEDYGDIQFKSLMNFMYNCAETRIGNSVVNYYSMIKEANSFIKFAIENGAQIKTSNSEGALNTNTNNPYFKIYN